MHIERIHEMIEKLTKCAEMELEKGVENIDAKEMGEVTDMIKDLCEAEYYAKISKAMDEAEYGEDYDEYGPMEEGRRGYTSQPRSKTSGRFMRRGDGRRNNGGRRGYEEPMYYRMTPEMYHDYNAEELRDMDREQGRMYYSGSGGSSSGSNRSNSMGGSQGGNTNGSRGYSDNMSNQRDSREGRSGQSRRNYMETKEMNKGNTPGEKQAKMKELENYTKELAEDVTEMISDASPEEKQMLKTKMQTLIQKIN